MRYRRRRLKSQEASSMVMSTMETSPAGGNVNYAIEIDLEGFEDLVLQRDPSAGVEWVAETLWRGEPFGTVGRIMPPGYEAYARVNGPRVDASFDPAMFDILARHTTT